MKKLALLCFGILFLCAGVSAQVSVGPISLTGSACASIDATGLNSVGIYASGTWSGTIQPKGSLAGQAAFNSQVTPAASSTPQATITGNGGFVASVAGLNTFLLCGNTITGTAVIFLNGSQASFNPPGVTGGGSTSGLVITSAGTPAPSPLNASSCPTGQGVWMYGLMSDSTYQPLASWNVTTSGPPVAPAGTITHCWREYWDDSGTVSVAVNRLMSVAHIWGHGGITNSTSTDESAITAAMANTDASFHNMHQALTYYGENNLSLTPTFGGHAGGEVSASVYRGNLNDSRTGVLSGGNFNVYSGQFSKSTDSVYPSGQSSVYWGYYQNAAAGNQSGVTAQVYSGVCADTSGTDTNHNCAVFFAFAPTLPFPTSNIGIQTQNFGTGANNFDLFLSGVNTAGTAAGFWGGQGPLSVGTGNHAASTYEVDILGATKIKAGAGVRQLDLFGSTSGSCGLSTDATSTGLQVTCPIISYNSITATGLGFPVEVGNSVLSSQTTSLGPTTLFTVGASTASFLVKGSVYCTTATATATVALTINYTDASNTAQAISPSAAACTTLGASSFDLVLSPIEAKNATAITYSTTAVNSPGGYRVSVQVYQLTSN